MSFFDIETFSIVYQSIGHESKLFFYFYTAHASFTSFFYCFHFFFFKSQPTFSMNRIWQFLNVTRWKKLFNWFEITSRPFNWKHSKIKTWKIPFIYQANETFMPKTLSTVNSSHSMIIYSSLWEFFYWLTYHDICSTCALHGLI